MVCWMGRFLCHGLYLHLHSQVHLLILTSQFRGSWIQKSHTILHLLCKCGFVQTWCKFHMWGLVKTPSPFKWFFQMLSFCFPLIVFPSAGFTPWSKNSHERGKGKGKGIVKEGKGKNSTGRGKGKRKEKERKRKRKGKGKGQEKESNRKRKRNWKKRQCLTRTIFDAKRYRFRYRFVIVRESCVCVPFLLEMAAIIKKGV